MLHVSFLERMDCLRARRSYTLDPLLDIALVSPPHYNIIRDSLQRSQLLAVPATRIMTLVINSITNPGIFF